MGSNIERVCTTLKQIVRDWSVEGADEREMCYGPILNELKILFLSEKRLIKRQRYFKKNLIKRIFIKSNKQVSILVPGSGLGRLAFEIASLGLKCEGNEFSMHMIMASNFLLNKYYKID